MEDKQIELLEEILSKLNKLTEDVQLLKQNTYTTLSENKGYFTYEGKHYPRPDVLT